MHYIITDTPLLKFLYLIEKLTFKTSYMKIITRILAILILFLSGTITSQNSRPIAELLVELSKNHMGSVTDVFTLDEIQVIRDHFAETTFPPNNESVANRRFSSSESVAIPINVVDINPIDYTAQILAASPIIEFPGAGAGLRGFDGTNRVLIIDNNNNGWKRNLGTGPPNFENLGQFTGVPLGHSITGIEVLPGPTAEIYGTTTNGVNDSRLVLIDISTRNVMPIGGNNGLILPIGLAHDENNNLYTIDIDDDVVYGMDTVSGAVSQIGELGTDANFGQAFFLNEANNQLTSLAYNSMIGDSEVRTVNPMTGESTSLGTISPGTVDQYGWGCSYDRDLLSTINSEIDGFSFYPNPVQNTLTLNATNSIETIEIYSVLGTMVKKQVIGKRTMQLDISELTKGAYILRVTTVKQSGVYKLIKD